MLFLFFPSPPRFAASSTFLERFFSLLICFSFRYSTPHWPQPTPAASPFQFAILASDAISSSSPAISSWELISFFNQSGYCRSSPFLPHPSPPLPSSARSSSSLVCNTGSEAVAVGGPTPIQQSLFSLPTLYCLHRPVMIARN